MNVYASDPGLSDYGYDHTCDGCYICEAQFKLAKGDSWSEEENGGPLLYDAALDKMQGDGYWHPDMRGGYRPRVSWARHPAHDPPPRPR